LPGLWQRLNWEKMVSRWIWLRHRRRSIVPVDGEPGFRGMAFVMIVIVTLSALAAGYQIYQKIAKISIFSIGYETRGGIVPDSTIM
jgi:hypothetical protein